MRFVVLTAGTTCKFCNVTTYHDVRATIDERSGTIKLEWPVPIPSGWDRVERTTPEWGLAKGDRHEERIRCAACIDRREGEADGWIPVED